MEAIQDLIAFLLVAIPLAGVARIVYCLCVMPMDQDEKKTYEVRIRNILVFIVFAETITGLIWTILNSF